ncbi:MAG: glycosyltransferase [Clostridiaceae bacterium]
MKKILFFINNLKYGGAEKVLVNLVNNLNREKYDLTVLVLFDEGVNKKYLRSDVTYRYVFKNTFRANSYILKIFSPEFLYKKCIKDDYDIVISYLEGATARILSACSNKKTKKISWQHTCVFNKHELTHPVFRNFNEALKVYHSFDAIVGVSNTAAASFSKVTGITEKIHVLYNTVETEKILGLGLLPASITFSSQVINMITVGRLVKEKGYERLLRIINRLVKDNIIGKKFHLYILGKGEYKDRLKSYMDLYNLKNYVTLSGYQENPYQYVSKADLFVCSSYNEGFSTAVTEALILGIPVVTTLCSGMEEMLGDNNEYGLITENNEEALYEGIKKMIADPDLLKHYKKMAGERGKYFSTEKTVKAVEELFDRL